MKHTYTFNIKVVVDDNILQKGYRPVDYNDLLLSLEEAVSPVDRTVWGIVETHIEGKEEPCGD